MRERRSRAATSSASSCQPFSSPELFQPSKAALDAAAGNGPGSLLSVVSTAADTGGEPSAPVQQQLGIVSYAASCYVPDMPGCCQPLTRHDLRLCFSDERLPSDATAGPGLPRYGALADLVGPVAGPLMEAGKAQPRLLPSPILHVDAAAACCNSLLAVPEHQGSVKLLRSCRRNAKLVPEQVCSAGQQPAEGTDCCKHTTAGQQECVHQLTSSTECVIKRVVVVLKNLREGLQAGQSCMPHFLYRVNGQRRHSWQDPLSCLVRRVHSCCSHHSLQILKLMCSCRVGASRSQGQHRTHHLAAAAKV